MLDISLFRFSRCDFRDDFHDRRWHTHNLAPDMEWKPAKPGKNKSVQSNIALEKISENINLTFPKQQKDFKQRKNMKISYDLTVFDQLSEYSDPILSRLKLILRRAYWFLYVL